MFLFFQCQEDLPHLIQSTQSSSSLGFGTLLLERSFLGGDGFLLSSGSLCSPPRPHGHEKCDSQMGRDTCDIQEGHCMDGMEVVVRETLLVFLSQSGMSTCSIN